ASHRCTGGGGQAARGRRRRDARDGAGTTAGSVPIGGPMGRVGPLVIVIALTAAAARPADDATAQRLNERIDARQARDGEIARAIWGFAELGYLEEKSSALLQSELKAAGFEVTAGVAGIPTAFVATWGAGQPVVAFVGEYDALPGLSQDAVPERKPVVPSGSGH